MVHIDAKRARSSLPPDADDPASDQSSLLGDAVDSSSSASGGLYQNSEYIGELDGHLAMLAEQAADRGRFMKSLENDVIQVQSMFHEFSYLARAQEPMVDDIERMINDTGSNVLRGESELIQARKHQVARRKKLCCLCLMMIASVMIFILFLWVAFDDN